MENGMLRKNNVRTTRLTACSGRSRYNPFQALFLCHGAFRKHRRRHMLPIYNTRTGGGPVVEPGEHSVLCRAADKPRPSAPVWTAVFTRI